MADKIAAFGEVMMRLAAPDYLKLKQTQTLSVSYVGTGVNILSGLSSFNNNVAIITKLPKNAVGDAATSHLNSLGISNEFITYGGDFLGKYFLESGFDLRPTKVTYANRDQSSFCTSTLSDYDLDNILKQVDIIHFCGITLAVSEETRDLVIAVAEKAQEHHVKVIFDCNYRPNLWNNDYTTARLYYEKMLSLSNVCFMNEKDAEYILGMETDKIEQKEKIDELLPQVAEKYKIELVAGTIRSPIVGEKHMIQGFVCVNKKITYSKEYIFRILDRIGGGDGFASGIIHAYVQQKSIDKMVEFGTASGVLAHMTKGDSPQSSIEEVNDLIQGDLLELER